MTEAEKMILSDAIEQCFKAQRVIIKKDRTIRILFTIIMLIGLVAFTILIGGFYG